MATVTREREALQAFLDAMRVDEDENGDCPCGNEADLCDRCAYTRQRRLVNAADMAAAALASPPAEDETREKAAALLDADAALIEKEHPTAWAMWIDGHRPSVQYAEYASAHRAGADAIRRLAQAQPAEDETRELAIARHALALIEPHTTRGITDCSTPLHIRVQNIVESLEKAEREIERLKALAQPNRGDAIRLTACMAGFKPCADCQHREFCRSWLDGVGRCVKAQAPPASDPPGPREALTRLRSRVEAIRAEATREKRRHDFDIGWQLSRLADEIAALAALPASPQAKETP